ncbi:hypothetical protein QP902_07565 [Corynebacterium marquesiae]|uniref:hypothetical protein n=1 Tax=Corynebacterium TaxID=1716 RepID=UPI00254F6267|nr:hypothetical protein [Corynebacterium marquesiae]MDK8668534.1 hypothetical protein [Corynebacterium marquesiae]
MPQENRETSGAATPKVTVNLSRDPIFNKEEVLSLIAGFKTKMDELIVAQEEFNRAFSQGRQFEPLTVQGQTASDLELEKSALGHRLWRRLGLAVQRGLRFARIRKSKTAE